MADTIGTAYIQIEPEAKGIQGKITEAINGGTSEYGKSLSGALGTAAKIGGAAIAGVGTAIAGVGAAMTKGVSNVASYGDNIDKMSQKMGISAESYQEWEAVMQHSGTSMESLKAGMKTLANAAENGNEAFERLGITEQDMANMSNEDLFSNVIAGLQNVDNETERTYLAGQLLGRGATELGALLNTSAEDTQAMKDRVHELGGVMSDEAVKDAAAFQDQLQDMQTSLSGLSRGMLSEVLPSFTGIMSGLTEIFSGNSDEGLFQISESISSLVSNIMSELPQVLEVGTGIAEALLASITENIPQIASAGTEIISNLLQGLIEALPALAEGAVELIGGLASGIGEMLPTLIPATVDMVMTIVQGLIDNIGMLVDGAIQLVTGLAEGLIAALPVLLERLPEMVTSIVTALIGNLPVLVDAVIQIATTLATAIIENLPLFIDAIIQINLALVQALIQNLPTLVQGVVQIVMALGQAIIQSAPALLEAVAQTIMSIIGKIGEAAGQFVAKVAELGSQVIAAMGQWLSQLPSTLAYWAGYAIGSFIKFFMDLPSNLSRIWENVKSGVASFGTTFVQKAGEMARNFFNSLMNGIQNLPGKMRSLGQQLVGALKELPDKFLSIGSDIVKGIWNGISEGWKWLTEKVAKLAESLVAGVKDALGIESPSKVFAAEVGRWIPAGIAVGIEDNTGVLDNAITDMVRGAMSVADVSGISMMMRPAYAADGDYPGGGYGGFVQNLNIYAPTELTPSEIARQAKNATRATVLALRGK